MSNENDMQFEERKQENVNVDTNTNQEQEYHRGGGGGGNNGFFSIKTNVYSRQCYSDPNNPGKMICKETKNTSGFDPFNQEKNYKKTKENVYTQEDPNFSKKLPQSQSQSHSQSNDKGKEHSIFNQM